jgi:phage shock protein PspC (stress-responsive transcriptional regulator)
MMKQLYRSDTDKKLAGVAGGLGAYLDMDATIIRVIFVIVFIFTAFFPAGLVYIILALVMPKKHEVKDNGKEIR